MTKEYIVTLTSSHLAVHSYMPFACDLVI